MNSREKRLSIIRFQTYEYTLLGAQSYLSAFEFAEKFNLNIGQVLCRYGKKK